MFTGGQFLNERTVPILTIYCMVPCKVNQMDRLICPLPVVLLKYIDVGTKEHHFLGKSRLGLHNGTEKKALR